MNCPLCGKRIGTFASMLGGRVTEWHTPRRGSKGVPTIGKGQCLGSGSVIPRLRKGK